MSFVSGEEMRAAARRQNLARAEAILRSDLAESRLTEEASRHAMHHRWHVMEATSREYDPAQRTDSFIVYEKKQFYTSKSSKWQRGRRIVEYLTNIFDAVQ